MTDLYELTRKLVSRGCPEAWGLRYVKGRRRNYAYEYHNFEGWVRVRQDITGEWIEPDLSDIDDDIVPERHAKAIWTMWALEWLLNLCRKDDKSHEYIELLTWTTHKCTTLVATYETVGEKFKPPYESCVDGDWSILEAIEVATRHLEAK